MSIRFQERNDSLVAVKSRSRLHGKRRTIVVKLPIQIQLTVREGLTTRDEVVSIGYEWEVFFNGREVERSTKGCPTEQKAIRAASKEARAFAKRVRERGNI